MKTKLLPGNSLLGWPVQRWLGLLCLLLLAGAMLSSARIGLSRAFSEYALLTVSESAAERAIRFNPMDAQAYYARGMALAGADRFREAAAALEDAIQLNPRDYFLWLKLGRTYDWQGEFDAARHAYQIATELAPFYAAPRWELGNLLLREGAREAAFAELRRASASNLTLLPAVIDLAWTAYAGEVNAVRRAIQPESAETQLILARYFAQRNELRAALDLLQAAGNGAAESYRRRLLIDLLDQKRFADAYQVWLTRREADAAEGQAFTANHVTVSNGGFEQPLVRDVEIPFGWNWADEADEVVKIALDPHHPHTGTYSLQLFWAGNLNIIVPVISQLIVVEPQRNYRLRFAARTQDLVSGGPPVLAVADASNKSSQLLSVSELLPGNSDGWRSYNLDFTTGPQTSAVRILLRRQCSTEPCPIYGRVWLDDFSVRRM
jgi:tetratricopeptide (TPR) repeat protein